MNIYIVITETDYEGCQVFEAFLNEKEAEKQAKDRREHDDFRENTQVIKRYISEYK